MTLTKKHFKAIAEIINLNRLIVFDGDKEREVLRMEILEDLSKFFKTENPNFDEDKFK